MRRELFAAGLLLAALSCHAQLLTDPDPDWKETEAPPPPVVRTEGLVPVDVGTGSLLRWGVDPASVSIGKDGVVRYVVVAQGQGGAVNAMYEGLRCSSGEVKVYARQASQGAWTRNASADWRPVGTGASRHSLAIARAGACTGAAPNVNAAQVVRDLQANARNRYGNESR